MISLRPRRNSGEGIPQYLARVAAANGYGSLGMLLKEFGLGEFGVMSGTIPDWSAVLPEKPSAASIAGGSVSGRWVTVSGQRIRRKQWSVYATPRICPQCWQADLTDEAQRPGLARNWQRTIWDIRALTVCEKHGTELVDHCECGRPLCRRTWLLDRCECGRPHHALESAEVEESDILGPRYLFDRLAGRKTSVPLLDDVDLGDAISAMEILGRAVCSKRLSQVEQSASPKHHVLLSAGLDVLARWPAGAIELFDDMISDRSIDKGWGVVKTYGPFYEMFRRIEPASLREGVAGLLTRHGLQNEVVRSRKTAFNIRVSDRTDLSLQETARRLGLSFERTRREVEIRGLDLSHIKRGRPALVPTRMVEAMEVELAARGTTLSAVCRQLSVGRKTGQDLVDRGLLSPRSPQAPFVFDDDAAESFVTSLLAAGSSDVMERRQIGETSKRYCVPIAQICEDIVADRLPCIAGGGSRFSDLHVCSRQAALLYHSKATARITIQEVAKRIGVKWEVASSLARLGFFGPKEDGGFRSIDVDTFLRNFRKNSDVARELKTSPKRLLQVSRSAGILAAASPPQVRQAYFSVSDAERLKSLMQNS